MNLRDSAKGEQCTFMLSHQCEWRTHKSCSTTVLCHVYPLGHRGKGKSFDGLSDDLNAAYGCYSCHKELDSMDKNDPFRWRIWLAAVIRTHRKMRARELLK
jgi:hypothetical protein